VAKAVRADQQTDTVDSALLQSISQITEQVDGAVAKTLAASAAAAQAQAEPADSELRRKVVRGVEKLQKGLLERETEVGTAQPRRPPPFCVTCEATILNVRAAVMCC
jgi:hypothetical protein